VIRGQTVAIGKELVMSASSLPVVVIGAGPVGLAAAAHVLSRNMRPLVFEAGPSAGAGIRRWAHVRMFSPWRYAVDAAAGAILEARGWVRPDGDSYPTGRDVVEQYLQPLAASPELEPFVRFDSRVVAVSRQHVDLMKDVGRSAAPLLVRVATASGEHDVLARAVIDASGTIETPGRLGSSGLPARGERAAADRIFYGIPDLGGIHHTRYAGKRVLVVGSGHSALNALLGLALLAETDQAMRITWAIRRPSLGALLGGARNDQLVERGRLGARIRVLLDGGRLELVTGLRVDAVTLTPEGVVVSAGERRLPPVDEVIAVTGFRPDWTILSEIRLDLDPAVQAPKALAPLIDPNVHSCGTVRPHGAAELKHPDEGVFAIGMKSYGRAPTFLLLTGYEQARSVVSAIAGDWEAARRVDLVLPETGVCSLDGDADAGAGGCCGVEAAAVAVTIGRGTRAAETAPPTSCCS
jgi:thioredoxin reductase